MRRAIYLGLAAANFATGILVLLYPRTFVALAMPEMVYSTGLEVGMHMMAAACMVLASAYCTMDPNSVALARFATAGS